VGALLISVGIPLSGCGAAGSGADGPEGEEGASDLEIVSGAPDLLAAAAQAPGTAPPEGPKTASLFEISPQGLLRAREVELPPGARTTREQAEALVRLLVAESGAFPPDTRVLDVFVSGRGVAVVNFTLDLLSGHMGGLTAEERTVYSLSHALISSFPAIGEVRFVVEGRQVETLAGHIDLRSGFGAAPPRLLANSAAAALPS